MYSRKCPTVHASTRFSQRSSVGRANGLRPISWDVLNADDQIQMKGRRKITRKAIRMAYVPTRPVSRPRLSPCEAVRVPANDSPSRRGNRHRQASCRSRRRMNVTEAMSEITVITTAMADAYPTLFWVNASL